MGGITLEKLLIARWTPIEEVAAETGYTPEPIRQSILDGRLPGAKRAKRWGVYVQADDPRPPEVIVTDIKIRFDSMVALVIKLLMAILPALAVIAMFVAAVISLLSGTNSA